MYIRKILHICAVALVVGAALMYGRVGALTLCAILLGAFIGARALRAFSAIRSSEHRSLGDLFLPVGLALAALLTLPADSTAFYLSAAVVGLTDPAASLVGRAFPWGTWSIAGERRSILGSTAFFIVALVAALIAGLGASGAALLALVLTGVEALSIRGSDNLTLPVVSALLLSVLA